MVLDVPDLSEEITKRGQSYRFEIVERAARRPHASDLKEIEFKGASRILLIAGVHLANGLPFAVEHRLVNLTAVPAIETADLSVCGPGTWLLNHIPWTEAENRIAAVAVEESSARLLEITAGSACLQVERRTWRGAEHITWVRQIFAPGKHELIARFGTSGIPAQHAAK
jgi:GntR family histidine utilization transcriptional repressor